jgi:hypothetical protein
MPSVEKEEIISCQIAYFPIDSGKYLDEIKDKADRIFDLIKSIHEQAFLKNYGHTMNIMFSNICGCKR